MIRSLLDIFPSRSVHHSHIALHHTFLNFKSSIGLGQVSTSHRMMVRGSHSSSTL
jgi:hypothetical protein